MRVKAGAVRRGEGGAAAQRTLNLCLYAVYPVRGVFGAVGVSPGAWRTRCSGM